MANRVLLAFLAFDMLFLLAAALLIAFPMIMKDRMNRAPTQETVAENLLLERCPLTGSSIPPYPH
jgi:hypothetical protein